MDIEEMIKETKWTQDCQDKWDFDFPILRVSTRLWGIDGGVIMYRNGKLETYKTNEELKNRIASAKATFMLGDKEILESDYIEADTNEECKKKTEEWIKDNYRKAIKLLESEGL